MTEREYDDESGSFVGDAVVVCVLLSTSIVGERGLSGVTGSECVRYHANTGEACQLWLFIPRDLFEFGKRDGRQVYRLAVPLWPNLEGSEDAPATAKRGEEKKVLRAASISASRF